MKSYKNVAEITTKRRSSVTLIAFLLFLCLVISNIFRLAVLEHELYRDKTFDEITTTSPLRAERGSIYDANMNLLASTSTTWRIFVSTKEIKTYTKKNGIDYAANISNGIGPLLNIDPTELYQKITSSSVLDVTLKSSASEDEYRAVLNFIIENGLDDLVFTEAQTSRYYPEGTMAAHVLGFTGSDNQGLYGLEYYYDSVLKGTDGYYLYAKDAGGNSMPDGYSSVVEPIDGMSLVTTIDSYVQTVLESIIEEIRVNHAVTDRVCGIVMNTETGAILGMATTSPFDPNNPFVLNEVFENELNSSGLIAGSPEYKAKRTELMQLMWSNKCLTETYEPGSTFKIITVAAALDSGAADFNDTFSCTGYHTVGGWRIKCHKTTGHGSNFSLAYGLQMSCNPTMMTIAERTGVETFYKYVEAFGYFEKSGIDLPSEASTIFHELSNMGPTELATASFGQRFKVSIINHLTAIATVANNGKSVVPYVVEKVIDANGNIVKEHVPEESVQVISKDVANELARVLEEGVSGDGGAKNAYVEGYKVAAKTGTSQKFDIVDENGNSYLRIGSTVAFAPSEESGVAVIIVVDEPQTTVKYGSTVAAPYVSKLLSSILPYLDYERTTEDSTFTVGGYVGMSVEAAKAELNGRIDFEVIGDGPTVIAQLPAEGIDCTVGISKIRLYTASITEELVSMPSVIGMSLFNANKLLNDLGLNIKLEGVSDLSVGCLTVVEQSVAVGERIKRGSVIILKALRTDFED